MTAAITADTKYFVGKTVQTTPLALTTGEKVLARVGRDKGQIEAYAIRVRAPKTATTTP